MEPVILRIKAFVGIINPSIVSDIAFDFIVRDVIDRALIFMNRYHLIAQYEKDILNPLVTIDKYVLPIPTQIERGLASIISQSFKTYKNAVLITPERAITSLSDNGQSISYANDLVSYFSSKSDQELFSNIFDMMIQFRLIKVITNDSSNWI